MPYTLDPQIEAALLKITEHGSVAETARGDALGLRRAGMDSIAALIDLCAGPSPDVTTRDLTVAVPGAEVLGRWYTRAGESTGSAVLYLHGGGMVTGSAPLYDRLVAAYVQETGVPFLSLDYRLAPENPGTGLVEDGFAGLQWLVAHAAELGVDPDRIAVMGDSGGGGVAAGVAIAARDRGVRLARQILVYPMIDDRNVAPDPHLVPFAVWTYDNNFTGWDAVLGGARGTADVPALAAPARLTDFTGLAPAYIEVGELDIFRDEDVAYAGSLARAGVPVEFHLHPGAVHGWDMFAPDADLTRRSRADRQRVITSF